MILASSGIAKAAFPDRPITIVIPFTSGSATDTLARVLNDGLSKELGVPVIVDIKPGASQTIAGRYVANAKADGYTLLLANLPAVLAPSVKKDLPYRGIRDFSPVARLISQDVMLVVSNKSAATSLSEFIQLLKENPDKFSYGSSGIASPIHLFVEMFNDKAGVKAVHIPYKGSQETRLAILSNQIDYSFTGLNAIDMVQNGKMKAFGIASNQRNTKFPDIPTLSEQGLSGLDLAVEYVIVAPKGTPDQVVDILNKAIYKISGTEEFYSSVLSLGGVRVAPPSTPAQVGKWISQEERKWDEVVERAAIKF